MDENRLPAYWAVLPASVRYDQELRPNAKLLYAEITALANASGYCFAKNETLGKLFGISGRTVSDLVGTLARRDYITVEVLRDPKTNEVTERRIWVDRPCVVERTPPIAKNGDTPIADFGVTPIAKNGEENNISSFNNTPKAPKRGRRSFGLKKAPDWKPERFAKFWDFYSHKARGENKQAAIRAWDKLQPADELIRVMGQALVCQVGSEAWRQGIGIPYASTWLNNARWEDVPKAPPDGGPPPKDAPQNWGWD